MTTTVNATLGTTSIVHTDIRKAHASWLCTSTPGKIETSLSAVFFILVEAFAPKV